MEPARDATRPEGAFGRGLRRLEMAGLWIAAAAVAALGLLIVVSIAGRALAGVMAPDVNVLAGDLMVAIAALGWGAVTATGGHIEVELFTRRAGPRASALLGAFGALVGLAMIVPLAWASWTMLVHALTRGTYYDGVLDWPQWPARMLFFIAFALMALRLLAMLAAGLRAAAARGG